MAFTGQRNWGQNWGAQPLKCFKCKRQPFECECDMLCFGCMNDFSACHCGAHRTPRTAGEGEQ